MFFKWWAKHESLFSIMAFFVHQILGIIGFQVKTERNFSLVGIFTNLRRCRLQLDNLDKLIFVSKNLPSDLRVSGSSPFSLIKLIEVDATLEEEFQEYEAEFERDELLDFKLYLEAFLKEKKFVFCYPECQVYPMDISDGGYPSILISDIRLIYFYILTCYYN